jgi:hypothetical protein
LRYAAEEVSSTDDDGDLAAERVDVGDFFGDLVDKNGVDTETRTGCESFAGKLEEDSLVHVRS